MENPKSDRFFDNQKRLADESSENTVQRLRELMEDILTEMQCFARVFMICNSEINPKRILDIVHGARRLPCQGSKA